MITQTGFLGQIWAFPVVLTVRGELEAVDCISRVCCSRASTKRSSTLLRGYQRYIYIPLLRITQILYIYIYFREDNTFLCIICTRNWRAERAYLVVQLARFFYISGRVAVVFHDFTQGALP